MSDTRMTYPSTSTAIIIGVIGTLLGIGSILLLNRLLPGEEMAPYRIGISWFLIAMSWFPNSLAQARKEGKEGNPRRHLFFYTLLAAVSALVTAGISML